MRAAGILLTGVFAAGLGSFGTRVLPAAPAAGVGAAGAFPRFRVQEIDAALSIGYAVLLADLDGDKKPDVVVVDQHKVVWYQNPGKKDPAAAWKKRVILDGKTKPDNVCAAAVDVDGDGRLDLVLGAGWRPSDTVNPGTLQWLRRGKSLDDEWTVHPIPCDEPTVHRVRAFDIDGDGKPEVVHVPLQGRGATAKGNWLDGRPVRIVAYKIPAKDPEKAESWKPMVLSEELHVCHNFAPTEYNERPALVVASYEGVTLLHSPKAGAWEQTRIGEGDQSTPAGSRGASEVKVGELKMAFGCIATIEPWHGNKVVVYSQPGRKDPWTRRVIDDHLRWGHAVWFADLDGEPGEELIIGVRDDPNPKMGDKHTDRRGVRVYKCTDGKGAKWDRLLVDEGGVAVEDLAAGDLDGDGKVDIVAVGRQTKNCKIYWNEGK